MNFDQFKLLLLAALTVTIGVLAGYAGHTLWHSSKPAERQRVAVEAPPAPEIKQEEKAPVKVTSVRAYKPAVKTKLKLPESVTNDDSKIVTAATRVDASERPVTVTSVLDTTTGETTHYTKDEPLPWLAVNTRSELGIYGGFRNGEPAVRMMGRQELVQIKAVHLGAIASADMTRSGGLDTFVGAGVWARW